MKKLFFMLAVLITLVSSVAYAADVVITITIPDAYVARVAAAIEGRLNCPEGVNAKACLTGMLIRDIKSLVRAWEKGEAEAVFHTDYDSGYVEPEVQ